ncbi:MAG: hypothetical protein GX432_12715 [Candidatus Atribacteria bacterium]|nr:hypothetical protein [Candidatus Atribacteria bacterium]
MKASRVILLILIGLTFLFVFDYSRGGIHKLGTQLSQLIILPTPAGNIKALDNDWFGK